MTKTCTRCHRDFTKPSRRGLCPACYMAVSERQKAYGRWELEYVDSQPVREHLAALKAAGMGARAVADASGLCRSTIRTVTVGKRGRGPSTRILKRNADAILAVPIPTMVRNHSGNVDATGTRRRVQALIAYGYSQRDISRRLGYAADNLSTLVHGDLTTVKQSTHDRVAALFDELSTRPGTDTRARNRGLREGWPLPLDWDDDEIDNPTATAERSPERHYDPRFDIERVEWRREKVATLTRLGLSANEIGAQLRVTERTVQRDRSALGLAKEAS